MIIRSYSKLNLSLIVNSKSKKKKKKKDKIFFKGPFAKMVKNRNNSIINLLKNLRELNFINNYYSVKVVKNIPVFGGLGGGTSNAAFILKYLLKNKVKNDLLNKLESLIGSDLKLFFSKQGFLKDLKTVINFKKNYRFFFLLIKPKVKCSSKEIYSKVKKYSKKRRLDKNTVQFRNNFLEYLSKSRNDLQFIVERKYPIIKNLLTDIKNEKGCCVSRMTGSGSVCYGLFDEKILAKKALNNLKTKYPKFWFSLAKTV